MNECVSYAEINHFSVRHTKWMRKTFYCIQRKIQFESSRGMKVNRFENSQRQLFIELQSICA